jgi:hypothetical protein
MGRSAPANPIELMSTPLFSVIVPLEYHRGQWERCWLGWQAQTLPKSQYELILVVPPDFPEQEKLPALLGPQDRLEYSTERHDIGLCAAGAARAHGGFLFFTESHCWPEPDVLEKCLHAFTAHPEWAAFSCQSIRITHNRLSYAEADMYDADIEHGMKSHPWRKVLDQCFVTRRDIYDECGGLKSELGHFAEWVLAANYSELGHKIGYVPEARLHHYYIGELAELRTFTSDFISGEMRYFSQEAHEPGGHLLEVPAEWICQGSWDRRLAQILLRIAMRDMSAPSAARLPRARMFAKTLVRWLMPAIVGEGAACVGALVKVWWAFAMVKLVSLVGSKARLSAAFKNYIEALIGHQRLAYVRAERRAQAETAGNPQGDAAAGWNIFAPENAGFYPIETFQETKFRWSETAAIMPTWMPEGQHRICIECLPVRSLMHGADLRFYFNERLLSAQEVSIGLDAIDIRLDLAQSCHSTLAWTCLPFPATGDRRWLGLPVKRIVWKNGSESPASKIAPRADG